MAICWEARKSDQQATCVLKDGEEVKLAPVEFSGTGAFGSFHFETGMVSKSSSLVMVTIKVTPIFQYTVSPQIPNAMLL